MRNLVTTKAWSAFLIAAILMSLTAGVALAEPGIDPGTVEELIFPGESEDVGKTVTTPEIPPKPDIYFLTDSTGSMGGVIAQVQADAAALLPAIAAQTSDPRFGAGDYKDFPSDPYAFQNGASIPAADDGGAGALAAIGGWSASGGGDGPEGQFYALDQIAEGVVNWRSDSTKIVVWFGDAPAHDPVCAAISGLGYDIDEASLTAKLVAQEIRVIAIGTTTAAGAFYPDALNDNPTAFGGAYLPTCGVENGSPGQADRIAAATGGVSLQDVAPEDIADAILEGLGNLPAEVSMESTCSDPISTTFAPDAQVVTSGDDALFTETIAVAAGAAGGTYTCYDYATINGEDMVDDAGALITEDKTIHVPGIDLEPETDINELGFDLDHTVVATVSAGDYGPVAGVRVEFEVSGQNAGPTGAGFTDAAGQVDFTYAPPVEPDSLGSDTIQACFTNADGTVVYGCDTAEKTWQDTTPPTAACVPTVNPSGKHVPNAPGNGGQGQNQDGFYMISGEDVVWPADTLQIFVRDSGSGTLWGPFPVGTDIKYVQAPGGTPDIKPMGGNNGNGNGGQAVEWQIKGTGDAEVIAVDGSGNTSDPVSCLVPPPPQ